MSQLVFQATLGGQTTLIGANTASTYELNVPAVNDTLVARTTTDTLTNKTLTTPTITGGSISSPTITTPTLTSSTITNYTESVVAIGTVSTASTISLTNGTIQTATLTASTNCVFTMPTATAGKSFVLLLKQAATTGNGTATFTGVKWNALGTPVVTVTAGKMDIFSFTSDGTNWYGSYSQGYTP